jgi:phosphoribosylformimino-5-aminoimidazole carboxamide ribotide isomerase
VAVARALVERAGARELYVADLDALAGRPPAGDVLGRLRLPGIDLWVDAGMNSVSGANVLFAVGVTHVVAALESLSGPAALMRLVGEFGPDRLFFSLDLREGTPLGWAPCGYTSSPEDVAAAAVAAGARSMIVLDLARVGTGGGTGTEHVCRHLTAAHPGLELIAGGGVRDRDDLKRLSDCGVSAALVATALHEGRL